MKTRIALTLALGFMMPSTVAFAQESGTQITNQNTSSRETPKTISSGPSLSVFNHIPAKSVLELTASPTYSSRKYFYTRRGAPYSSEFETTALGLKTSYGVRETVALSLQTSYGESTTKRSTRDYTFKFSGFSDLIFQVTKIFPQASKNIILDVTTSFSPGTSEDATRNRTGNRLSGGNEIQASLGFEWNTPGGLVAGYTGSHRLVFEKESRASDSRGNSLVTTRETGGDESTLTGFVESQLSEAKVGAELSFQYKAARQIKETYSSSRDIDDYGLDPETSAWLSAYGNILASPGFEVLPRLTLTSLVGRDLNGNEYNSSLGVAAQVGARASF
jgi:hypothetical protein